MRNIRRVDTPAFPPWKSACPSVDLSLSDVRKEDLIPSVPRARAIEYLSSYEGHIFTFTDGSKTEDGVGCAFICGQDTRSLTLPRHSSVFTSERVAISKALCFIEAKDEAMHLKLSDF